MDDSNTPKKTGAPWLKVTVMLLVAGLFGFLYFTWGDQLSLTELAQHESGLRAYQAENAALVFALAFGIYVLVSGLSLPGGATVLSLAYAWFFGFWPALLLVSFASTTGATLAFLLSRLPVSGFTPTAIWKSSSSLQRSVGEGRCLLPLLVATDSRVPLLDYQFGHGTDPNSNLDLLVG